MSVSVKMSESEGVSMTLPNTAHYCSYGNVVWYHHILSLQQTWNAWCHYYITWHFKWCHTSFIKGENICQNRQSLATRQSRHNWEQCNKRFFPWCQCLAWLQIKIYSSCYLTQLCGLPVGTWYHYTFKAHRAFVLHRPLMPDNILIDLTLTSWTHQYPSPRITGTRWLVRY